jgi:CubicO group peptidase (beta-lactamase class C family)
MNKVLYRFSLLLFILALAPAGSYAQGADAAGDWNGAIELPGQKLEVTVRLKNDAGKWSGSIDIPAQGAKGLPLEEVGVTLPELTFAISGVPGHPTFRGRLSGDSIAGTFTQGKGSFPFRLKQQSAAIRQQSELAAGEALDSIRAFIPAALKRWRVPGTGIAIVRDGKVVLSEGFGYRDVEGKLPVTPNTLFAIGSSTKAFTAYIIGSLVAEGKLDWDTPVIHYIPEFKLKDQYTTEHMTPRDLLNHISGLPRHDLIWYGSSLTRRELFERLQYLEPNAEFRTKWQYQNLMFMTAGYLAEKVSGTSWETLVRERIFAPLGMNASLLSVDSLKLSADHAVGYGEEKKEVKKLDYRNIDAMGPAGSINSNATDMAKWVMLHLSNGKVGGEQLIPPGIMQALHAPQVVMSGAPGGPKEMLFHLYGMGWMMSAYRGHRLLQHGGNIDGFSAMVTFMPDDDIGMVILTNMDGTEFPTATMLSIYDQLLGYHDVDWNAKLLTMRDKADSLVEPDVKEANDDIARVPNTRPSHALKDYTGEFENPAYGTITVKESHDRLGVSFHGFDAKLEHFHYDVFRLADLEGTATPFDGVKMQFQSNVDGDIDRVTVPLEPSVAPIVFTRRPPASLGDSAALALYVGSYELAGQHMRVHIEHGRLFVTVPGQPDYELLPSKQGEFSLKGLTGFNMRFEPAAGPVTKAVLMQPNGNLVAVRE